MPVVIRSMMGLSTDALDENYITKAEYDIQIEQLIRCTKLVNGFINYLEKQKLIK